MTTLRKLQNKIQSLIPYDKSLHFMFGAILASIALLIFYPFMAVWSIPMTLVIGAVVFFIIEIHDEYEKLCKLKEEPNYKGAGFDWLDILFGYYGLLTVLVPVCFVLWDDIKEMI